MSIPSWHALYPDVGEDFDESWSKIILAIEEIDNIGRHSGTEGAKY